MQVSNAKQRNRQHIIDAEGEQLFKAQLPRHWVVREYRPDYGLDFSVEVFQSVEPRHQRGQTYETLGEHFFVQLKSTESLTRSTLPIFARHNVEMTHEAFYKTFGEAGRLEIVKQRLDTSELVTVGKMGVGVPVLLVIAELRTRRCYFVCLNDYIDKILIPRFRNYGSLASRIVHVPLRNQLSDQRIGPTALRWYAKRPKLYAAFHRFIFQYESLEQNDDVDPFEIHIDSLEMARYFAERNLQYDFWDDMEMWPAIGRYGAALRHFLMTGEAWNLNLDAKRARISKSQGRKLNMREQVLWLWKMLSRLPAHYEDECREWLLPTFMGHKGSYSNRRYVDSLECNLSNIRYPQAKRSKGRRK
jgi:hypothetical protein